MTDPSHQITELLLAWRSGDAEALDKLMPLVYDQLHSRASHYLRQERPDHTLRTTDLVHEAYLKLLSSEVIGEDRVHFMAIIAITMRRILCDHARGNHRVKRGGGGTRVVWDDALLAIQPEGTDFLDLDAALTRLSEQDPRKARLIELSVASNARRRQWCSKSLPLLSIGT